MEKTIVKFSRPLLFRESIDGKYYLAYGFVLDEDKLVDGYDKEMLYDYVAYCSGMHLFAAGAGFFDVNYDYEIPMWMDKKGNPHFVKDKWTKKMAAKCRDLIGLTYEVIRMEIDDETYAEHVNSTNFITNEKLFDGLEKQGEKDNEELDDLPF